MDRRAFVVGIASILTAPLVGASQQQAMPLIGYLHFASAGPLAYQVDAFHQGLSETGYIEKKNVSIEYRWADGMIDRLPALATDLVGHKVDVIVAVGPPAARAAKNATSTIPIVFAAGTDPVAEGLIANLARPGANLTGISILAVDLSSKRLELISELVPKARVIALLVNPKNLNPWVGDVHKAAHVKGLQLQILKASTASEIDAAFATLAPLRAEALIIGDDVFFTSRREQLVALTRRYAIPTIERWREFPASGGLISYGPSLKAVNHQLGVYAGKILSGVINLKTAKALGLTIPPSLLLRADQVIE